ncbi:hypothetical protein H2199_002008 [Coniosporium tulheliwenetii]|uniref:Uncharacterized protein n=1 Tax=Coniosporium tulheliwenetii TaxID=3383036 RepID=A0ACC2ZHK2_9PEZI|nr:hypothetical protein H2199_002008 [Cladosporium sp. JES 115]
MAYETSVNEAPSSSMSAPKTVPVVDFSRFLHGSVADKRAIAREIDEAFRNVGFVYLQNHGVPQQKVDECFEWSQRFFALPEAVKKLAPHPPGGSHHRGYSGLGVEKVTQNVFDSNEVEALRQMPDFKESFESGNVHDQMQPNIWLPDEELPGFRQFMEAFFLDCAGLIHTILHALAISLSLPPSQLSDAHSQSLFQLRLLHYPSIPSSLLHSGEKSRIGAHSDFGTLTLLFQDDVGGLEIQHPQTEEFIAAPPIPGGVLVNIGDLMMRWSNGRWRSTVHRVVAPPVSKVEREELGDEEAETEMCRPRYSIPFFATADPETVIECLPGCEGPDGKKEFEAMTALEYVQMRMAALYA